MDIQRRHLIAAGAGLGLAATAAATEAKAARTAANAGYFVFHPLRKGDATARLQQAIDHAAKHRLVVLLMPGTYTIGRALYLRPRTKLLGAEGLAIVELIGGGTIIGRQADELTLADFVIDGRVSSLFAKGSALLTLNQCPNLTLRDLTIRHAPVNAIKLWEVSGRIHTCRIEATGHTAINSGNSGGIDIAHNRVHKAGNNGIVVWRQKPGSENTTITNNTITAIRTDAGGSGQNGNAINVFRAGNVLVSGNSIAQCAYSAVRCNAASNAQIVNNNCRALGEVALYAEFAFEGAVIANNVIDGAATGISVTNFKEGGRLSTVTGNIVRNLVRREHEPVDKRGIGISVEADTVVQANTVEDAATAGITIGWGPWQRNVAVSGNLVRKARTGITVSRQGVPGSAVLSGNIISESHDGAVVLHDFGRPTGLDLTTKTLSAASPAVLQGNVVS